MLTIEQLPKTHQFFVFVFVPRLELPIYKIRIIYTFIIHISASIISQLIL